MLKEQLIAARTLVAAGWTQRYFVTKRPILAFEDFSGDEVVPISNHPDPKEYTGMCFCAVGAVVCATGVDPMSVAVTENAVLTELREALGHGGAGAYDTLTAWNDQPGRTQAEVLELFDKAIANA